MKDEFEALAGTWSMGSGERGEQKLPDMIVKSMLRTVKGNEVTVTMNGQISFQAVLTLNPDAFPKTMDYLLTQGPNAGKTQLGIYELSKGTLKLCFADPGKKRPSEFSSKNGALLTLWQPAKKGSAGALAANPDEVQIPQAPKSNGQVLGDAVEIAISVASLDESLPFYEKLGFKKLSQSAGANPSAKLTDGMIIVSLDQGSSPSPILTYYAADMDMRISNLEKLGIPFESKRTGEAYFVDANGLRVRLVRADASKHFKVDGKSFSKCGMFGELCVKTRDAKASASFWDKAGFGTAGGGEQPYPYRILMDGKIIIGVHEGNDEIKMPTITYFDRNITARIDKLKQDGLKFESENNGAVVKAPDGQMFFLYNW